MYGRAGDDLYKIESAGDIAVEDTAGVIGGIGYCRKQDQPSLSAPIWSGCC